MLRVKDLLLCVHVVVKTLNLKISRWYLTDYVKELYLSACRTCSTIIFLIQPIRSLFSGVVVAVAVVLAQIKLKLTINTIKSNSNFGFWGEGKPEFREKTCRCRVENQQTQPTFDGGSENWTRATLVGGECSHHCAIPVFLDKKGFKFWLSFSGPPPNPPVVHLCLDKTWVTELR